MKLYFICNNLLNIKLTINKPTKLIHIIQYTNYVYQMYHSLTAATAPKLLKGLNLLFYLFIYLTLVDLGLQNLNRLEGEAMASNAFG